jgi:colicin import membrane protein
MLELFKRNPKAVSLAVAMHLVLILLLIFGLDWLVPPKDQRPAVNVVQARVVDASAVAAEAERLETEANKANAAEEAKKAKAEKEIKELEKKRQDEQKKLQDVEKQRKEAEQKRKTEEKLKIEAEQKRKAAEDAKRKADAEAKKQDEARQKAETEQKQKAEAEKKKAEDEKKRKAAEDAKRKADEDRKRREADLQSALEAEQSGMQSADAINAFALAVSERVTSNWIRPPATEMGLKVKLRVRVSDQGSVLAVQVVQSSGNSAFDRSAEAAVYKSDPLPKPPPGVRELNFTFDPDKV